MYPELPKSPADLVPLPLCEGPKLKPFDFKGPQDIEFIEYIGQGQHSHVVKVRIHNNIYALKLFRFHGAWNRGMPLDPPYSKGALSAFYQYQEFFNRECRAFGRLQESGWQDLAIDDAWFPDEAHASWSVKLPGWPEREPNAWLKAWLEACKIDQQALDRRFPVLPDGDAGAGGPPIRGILKALGTVTRHVHKRDDTRYLADICKMQQLGITGLDPNGLQLIDWKQADFSRAVTTPHPMLTPLEMNPHIGPEWLPVLDHVAFFQTSEDYIFFNCMILGRPEKEDRDWNPKKDAPPTYDCRGTRDRYDLRKKPHRQRRFAFVDPRKCDWRPVARDHAAGAAAKAATSLRLGRAARPGRGSKAGRPRGISKAWNQGRPQLKGKPDRWCFEHRHPTGDFDLSDADFKVTWEYRDGHFFPCGSPKQIQDEMKAMLLEKAESEARRRDFEARKRDWEAQEARAKKNPKTKEEPKPMAEPEPMAESVIYTCRSAAEAIMRTCYPNWCNMSAEEQAQTHEKTCRELARDFWAQEQGLAQEPKEAQAQKGRFLRFIGLQMNQKPSVKAWCIEQQDAGKAPAGKSLEERAPGEGFSGWFAQFYREGLCIALPGKITPSFANWANEYFPELWAREVRARDAEASDEAQ